MPYPTQIKKNLGLRKRRRVGTGYLTHEMATARLSSLAKANMRTFGVLISMVFHCVVVVCGDNLAWMSRNE